MFCSFASSSAFIYTLVNSKTHEEIPLYSRYGHADVEELGNAKTFKKEIYSTPDGRNMWDWQTHHCHIAVKGNQYIS